MVYRIGICDDDGFTQKINAFYVDEVSKKLGIEITINTFSEGEALLEYVKEHEIHVLFLDIGIRGMSGLEIAEALRKINRSIVVIFVTSHKEYALDAFKVDAVDYLVKPYQVEELEAAFRKALNHFALRRNQYRNTSITIIEDYEKVKIPQRTIVAIEKQGNACIIYQTSKVNRCYATIKKISEELEDYFLQVNEGFIINSKFIKSIEGNSLFMKSLTQHEGSAEFYRIGRKFLPKVRESFYGTVV